MFIKFKLNKPYKHIIRGVTNMANSKLIVVEGAQGAGKTTVTDYLRYSLSYTNL